MTDFQARREHWQKRRAFKRLLERSSLAYDSLWGICKACGGEQARDPFTDQCVRCQGILSAVPYRERRQ